MATKPNRGSRPGNLKHRPTPHCLCGPRGKAKLRYEFILNTSSGSVDPTRKAIMLSAQVRPLDWPGVLKDLKGLQAKRRLSYVEAMSQGLGDLREDHVISLEGISGVCRTFVLWVRQLRPGFDLLTP